jgi:hypothetical protein
MTRERIRFFVLFLGTAISWPCGVEANGGSKVPAEQLFATSAQCMSCHNRLSARSGEDISIGTNWRAAMMSNSAADPYWHAGVRREILDHPKAAEAIEATCSKCHMPMAHFMERQNGKTLGVFSNLVGGNTRRDTPVAALAGDGVSCSGCHQIAAENLGKAESFGANFVVDTETPLGSRAVFGPFEVSVGNGRIMNSATGFTPTKADHIRTAAHCGSCHTLYTHALDENGRPVAELPEQMPYVEWLHSDHVKVRTCQDCHMKRIEGPAAVSSVLGVPRAGIKKHDFTGGNFFMLRMLSRNSSVLGLGALPSELNAAADAAEGLLTQEAALISVDESSVSINRDTLSLSVVVENLAGHKLPTAYPSRRVWIHLLVADEHGNRIFESGALKEDGSISENDNDSDGTRFEPHYQLISRASEVQIYEAILATPEGKVTTGLLKAASYAKDNRILPSGFTKASAPKDVAVWGHAADDPDFSGGSDRVEYRIRVAEAKGPFTITVELWYQPIGYRWAENLASVDAFEPTRFVAMYRSMPGRETAVRMVAQRIQLPAADSAPAPGSPPRTPSARSVP